MEGKGVFVATFVGGFIEDKSQCGFRLIVGIFRNVVSVALIF